MFLNFVFLKLYFNAIQNIKFINYMPHNGTHDIIAKYAKVGVFDVKFILD
jgi:hypothetical protein